MNSNPVRMRRILMLILAAGLFLIMAAALLLQSPFHDAARAPYLMALLLLGCVLAVPASLVLTTLQVRALFAPALRAELWDEQALQNNQKAMSLGFIVMLAATGYVLPVTVWQPLPVTPTLTGILLAGLCAYLIGFALFERAGDDG